jgi:hypothetical protein
VVVVVPTEPGSAAVLLQHISRHTDAYVLTGIGTAATRWVRRKWGVDPNTDSDTARRAGPGQTLLVTVLHPSQEDYAAQR